MKATAALTPPAIAARYGVHPKRVRQWIRTGDLRALNLATDGDGPPRFAILPEDLAAFERSREACADGAA